MKKSRVLAMLMAVATAGSVSTAEAQVNIKDRFPGEVRFKGVFQGGPLAGYVVKGHCSYPTKGDPLAQTGECTVTATGPQRPPPIITFKDNNAGIELVDDQMVLKVTLGLTRPDPLLGKLVFFTALGFLDGPYLLFAPRGVQPTGFQGHDGSITIGEVSASSVDLLIYDFIGPAVHADPP